MKKWIVLFLIVGCSSLAMAAALSQWTAYTEEVADGDIIAMTDISDTTDSENGTSKKATATQFFSYLSAKILATANEWTEAQTFSGGLSAVNVSLDLGSLSGLTIGDEQLVDDTIENGDTDDEKHLWSIERIGNELVGKQDTVTGSESAFDGWDKDATDDFDGAYSSLTGAPTLGSAASRQAEDMLTDGSNLPDGAAIIAYGDANWSDGGLSASANETITGAWTFSGGISANSVAFNLGALSDLTIDASQLIDDTVENGATDDDKRLMSIQEAHTRFQAIDANLPVWPAAVDATEVGYLDGVTSGIQTQIGGKEDADAAIVKSDENEAITANWDFSGQVGAAIQTATHSSGATLTAAQNRGYYHFATASATLVIEAAAGNSGCLIAGQGVTAAIGVQPASGDYLVVDGVRGTVATAYVSSGAAGDKICWACADATDCYVTSEVGTWSE